MRTLRQVADYIQMAADNPCVPNPERFIPVEDSPLIPAIKIKDHLELQLMKSHGMTATREKVCLTSYCPDDHSQWAAALPFSLDLKWVVRTGALDIHKPVQTKYKHAIDLAWFQWLVESVVDPQAPDEKKLSQRHSHAHCSMAVFHAAYAPLQVEHIHTVQKYLTLKSERNKHKRLELRREDFEAFRKENYAYDGAPPSPYELKASHPPSVVGEHLDELMVLVKRGKDQVRYTVSKTRVESWEIMKALIEMYPDEQVERVFSYLEEYSRGVDLDGMEQRARKGNDVGDEAMEKVNLKALQTVREMVGILAAEQLGWMVTYFRGNKLRVGLDQLRRNK